MVKKILPPLDDDNAIPNLAKAGNWVEEDNSLIGRLSKGLKVSSLESKNSEELVSVPDVWARTAVVKNALCDPRHSLHEQITSEWRGLLALFALLPSHGQTLETEVINIADLKTKPFPQTKETTDVGGNFAQVLYSVTPKAKLDKSQNWHEIGIIKLNRKNVGLLVPSTIVCPARYYADNIDQSIPWFKSGKLIDPCAEPDVRPESFLTLIYFIDQMIDGLKNIDMEDQDTVTGIMGALQSFKEKCQERSAGVTAQGFKNFNIGFNFPQQPVYQLLQNIVVYDSAGKNFYDTFIPSRVEIQEYIKGFIFVDPTMPTAMGDDATKIRIWNDNSLQKIIKNKKVIEKIKREVNAEQLVLLTPEEIFTKKLCIFPSNTDNITEHIDPAFGNQFLYPFNPIVLNFYTPKQLRENFSIADQGDGIYKVSLKINLLTNEGDKKTYTIWREYDDDSVINNIDPPTASALWPNFSHPSWNQYFLFYATSLQASIALHHTFGINELKKSLLNSKDAIGLVENLKGDVVELSKRLAIEESSNEKELHFMSTPPEALFCDVASSDDITGYILAQERQAVGLLLLPIPRQVSETSNRWKIGIDFGTTNSCAYFRENENIPKEIKFKNRLYSPFEFSDTGGYYELTLRDFLPDKEVEIPFLTIARDRKVPVGFVHSDNLPIWTSFIYYVSDMRNGLQDIENPDDRPLRFNLKWSDSPEDRIRIETFLSQVALQCLGEALASGIQPSNISWAFSYPESFTPDKLRSYKELYKSSLMKAYDPIGQEDVEQPEHKSESLTSALYFANELDAAFAQSVITIDIGGETSDISIWQDRKLLWRSSTRIAGRHILIDFLKNNIELINDFSQGNEKLLEAFGSLQIIQSRDDDMELGNAIEVIVNSPEFLEVFNKRMHIVSGKESTNNLRGSAEFALSGILYYVAQVVHNLKEKEIFKTKVANRNCTICLGGRASILFKKMFADKEQQIGLRQIFSIATKGIFKPDQISLEYTKKEKHEVSYGLLMDEVGMTKFNTSTENHDVMLGENISIGGKTISYDKSINDIARTKLDTEWRPSVPLKNLKEFQEQLQRQTGISINIDRSLDSDVANAIEKNLINIQEKLKLERELSGEETFNNLLNESLAIEPPFIVAIRDLLSRINKKKIEIQSRPPTYR